MNPRGEKGERGERGPPGEPGERGEPGEDWAGYRRLIISELKRLSDSIDDMRDQQRSDHVKVVADIAEVKNEIGQLKVKSGFYGALAGLGSAVALFAAQLWGGH